MSFSILSRYSGAVLYASATADTIADAVVEAVKNGANLYGANLDGANLTRANLYGANLDGANLYGANLDGANLTAETKIDRVAIVLIGSRHVITAYADRVRIGCHERSYESWLKIYRKVGEEEGYTPEQIDEYGDLIRRAQAMVAAIPTEVSE
jgi:hypothetical protein